MRLLAPRDAARRLRLSVSRLTQFDREGVLPAMRDSAGRRLYEAESVERFAVAREERRSKACRTSDEPSAIQVR
jgi:DNA-binding transcriptional MerR regulator